MNTNNVFSQEVDFYDGRITGKKISTAMFYYSLTESFAGGEEQDIVTAETLLELNFFYRQEKADKHKETKLFYYQHQIKIHPDKPGWFIRTSCEIKMCERHGNVYSMPIGRSYEVEVSILSI